MNIADVLAGTAQSTQWIKAHLDYPHKDWCLIWPLSRDSDGYCQFGTRNPSVHRLMCWHRNGPPPADKPYAAHSCGRGHEGCVNQWHLNWRSNSENQLERFQHAGTILPRFKLSVDQVDEILALKGQFTTIELARRFGVSRSNVSRIHNHKNWAHSGARNIRIFSADEVRLIRSVPWKEKSALEFANQFGVSRSTIDRIRNRQTYQYVSEAPDDCRTSQHSPHKSGDAA